MCLASAAGQLGPVGLKHGPLRVSVEQHSALVKGAEQQQRRSALHSVQAGYAHLLACSSFDPNSQLDRRVGSILGKRHQQIQI